MNTQGTASRGPNNGGERFDTPQEGEIAYLQAGKVFLPNTAINTHDLFSGRKRQITMVLDSINQPGLHAVIFGERGVGKTSLANVVKPVLGILARDDTNGPLVVKVNSHSNDSFSDAWHRAFSEVALPVPRMGFGPDDSDGKTSVADAFFPSGGIGIDDVRRTIEAIGESVFVFDEFDRMPTSEARSFTDLIKMLSDFSVSATIILVGVSATISGLVSDHQSITRAITQVPMPRMGYEELRSILSKGESALGMKFEEEAAILIIKFSQGLPHYAHLLGLHAVRTACSRWSRVVSRDDVTQSLRVATDRAYQSIAEKYTLATRSAHQDALYAHVLLACAITASRSIDALGYFQAVSVVEPLRAVMPDRDVKIGTFSSHLGDFCDEKRGHALERTGQKRNYRYRFTEPLLPPFVIINGVSTGMIDAETVVQLVRTAESEHLSGSGQMPLF